MKKWLWRSGNQEQAQRIAQQIQIQAAAMPSKENWPHVNSICQQHFPNPRYTHIGSSNLNIEFTSGQILSNSLEALFKTRLCIFQISPNSIW